MAEVHSERNFKEKINAVRSVVSNKSNNEIVLVLQQFDNNVDKTVQAFMDGSAAQVLKEWNLTGKKKNHKKKRSKSKQQQQQKNLEQNIPPESETTKKCDDHIMDNYKINVSYLHDLSMDGGNMMKHTVSKEERHSISEEMPLQSHLQKAGERDTRFLPGEKFRKGTLLSTRKPNAEPPKLKPSAARSQISESCLDVASEDAAKKRGPSIEKSMKDLQRCTVSLTRYRTMIKEEMDSSVKKIKATFAELQSCIIDREVSLMAELDKVKEDAMEILNARQKKAMELKKMTDMAIQMSEIQLSELRAEIKLFVSERKYDEELGRSARFTCEVEPLKETITSFGEVSHPKNSYSTRTPCTTILSSLSMQPVVKKQSLSVQQSAPSSTSDGPATTLNRTGSKLSHSRSEVPAKAGSKNNQGNFSNQRRRANLHLQGQNMKGAFDSGSSEDAGHIKKETYQADNGKQQQGSFRPKYRGISRDQNQLSQATSSKKTVSPVNHLQKKYQLEIASHTVLSDSVSPCSAYPVLTGTTDNTVPLKAHTVTLVA
ncbi:SPATS2-like protein [Protopterus annectens]|uniref:SPATS2-like protein n=1 Tax=Protopterus annectens TaxID=7888 RepID=UPI001CF97293|nr:SPATS2-like protein [Protopterus annectens]